MSNGTSSFAPRDFLGLVGNELQIAVARNGNLAYLAQQYRRAGVRPVRVALDWESIEAQPDRFDWGYADLRVSTIANAGLRTVGILGRTPRWASSCPGEARYDQCIAANLDTYRDYVRRTVRRYGAPGTGQIRDWEIRVESNPIGVPPGAYGVEDYVEEANAAFAVIRQEDPAALVWVGEFAFGRFNSDAAMAWTTFVAQNANFDVHTIHHFNSPADVLNFTRAVRQRLNQLGHADKPLAVTAMNVFVENPDTYTEAMQAANLRALYQNARQGGAAVAMWFAGTQWPDLADKRYGIFRYNFNLKNRVTPRRAYTTLRELGQELPGPLPPAVPYGCMGVSSNPCTPVGAEARVALHFFTTGLGRPRVQIREGQRVLFCGHSNQGGFRDLAVPRGTSRTLTLFGASSCAASANLTGPLAQVTVRALP